jgi:hypothetical protein
MTRKEDVRNWTLCKIVVRVYVAYLLNIAPKNFSFFGCIIPQRQLILDTLTTLESVIDLRLRAYQ